MNKASRMKDISQIYYYGPFASALGFIVHCGNCTNNKVSQSLTFYRGLQITPEEIDENF